MGGGSHDKRGHCNGKRTAQELRQYQLPQMQSETCTEIYLNKQKKWRHNRLKPISPGKTTKRAQEVPVNSNNRMDLHTAIHSRNKEIIVGSVQFESKICKKDESAYPVAVSRLPYELFCLASFSSISQRVILTRWEFFITNGISSNIVVKLTPSAFNLQNKTYFL